MKFRILANNVFFEMTTTTTLIRLTSKKEKSPGPGEYTIPSKFGNEGTRITLVARPQETTKDIISAPFQDIGSTIGKGPKYSLRSRPADLKTQETSPGPNYLPPSFGSSSPAHILHKPEHPRSSSSATCSPGPAAYKLPDTVSSKKGFTLKPRIFPPDEGHPDGPGPGLYVPKYDSVLPKNSGALLGPHDVQEHRAKSTLSPGPGQYVIPSSLSKKGPTFHARTVSRAQSTPSPGPGAYNTAPPAGSGVPKFSIRPRLPTEEMNHNLSKAPYQNLPSTVGSGPKFSFGQRLNIAEKQQGSPGPSYLPPKFGSDAQKSAFHGRFMEDIQPKEKRGGDADGEEEGEGKKKEKSPNKYGPGPDQYQLGSTVGTGHKFTMKGRNFPPEKAEVSPGPGAYTPKFTAALDHVPPPITIRDRLKDPADKEPKGKYVALPPTFGKNAPKYTIGRREDIALAPGAA